MDFQNIFVTIRAIVLYVRARAVEKINIYLAHHLRAHKQLKGVRRKIYYQTSYIITHGHALPSNLHTAPQI